MAVKKVFYGKPRPNPNEKALNSTKEKSHKNTREICVLKLYMFSLDVIMD